MSESNEHRELVKRIVDYVRKIVPQDNEDLIYVDLDGYIKPKMTYGRFVPDVLYLYKGLQIIGEAKTYDDFFREHSKQQYLSYIQEAAKYNGESIIVIAIPWDLVGIAKNHFMLLKQKYECKARVLILLSNGLVREV